MAPPSRILTTPSIHPHSLNQTSQQYCFFCALYAELGATHTQAILAWLTLAGPSCAASTRNAHAVVAENFPSEQRGLAMNSGFVAPCISRMLAFVSVAFCPVQGGRRRVPGLAFSTAKQAQMLSYITRISYESQLEAIGVPAGSLQRKGTVIDVGLLQFREWPSCFDPY